MNSVTVEDMFRAVKEYGSVRNAARALKIKGSKIYYNQRKDRWKELEKDFKSGKLKIKKKDPSYLVDARSNQFIQERIGKTIKVSDVPIAPRLKLRTADTEPDTKKKNNETVQEDEDMTVEVAEVTEEQRKSFHEEGYNKAVEEYEVGMKELMDKLKESEKAKEKVEIQRDATRNVNEQLEKRLESAKTEINKYKAHGNAEALSEIKSEKEQLEADNRKFEVKVRGLNKELEQEKRLSARLSNRIKEIQNSNVPAVQSDEPEVEFYKDTMHLYYEKFKALKKA